MPRVAKPKRKEGEPVRLNRYIAEAGVASRRAADELISAGKVTVNGAVGALGMKIKPGDQVIVEGNPVSPERRFEYLLFNKPKDCICSASDERGRRTIFEMIRSSARLFSVGRLDRNSMGVLLLTNDGDLAHRLQHPRYGVEKVYLVELDSALAAAHRKSIEKGVELDDGKTSPVTIELDPKDASRLTVTMHEGRNRQVRRMFEAFEYRVTKLDRIMYGGLTVQGIKRGESRPLKSAELSHLRKMTKLPD
jgi:23S rRNA pseudouridine2605 synthase